MESGIIDLYAPTFWMVALVGVLVCFPITDGKLRRAALAVLNLCFLGMALGWIGLGPVLLGLGAAYLLVRWVDASRSPTRALLAGIVATGTLFLLHKLEGTPLTAAFRGVNPILAGVGFSYGSLRLVDMLRVVSDRDRPAPDPFSLINYLVPFHMIAAGPIQSYAEFCDQPEVPEPLNFEEALRAIERIVFGMFKKFVIAAAIKEIFLTGFEAEGAFRILEVQFFFLWLYADFSAYSDIAVGVGRLLGVRTPENFNRPYFARNLIEFWDRWHISLSLFVRRNIFIPLQLALVRSRIGSRPLVCASLSFIATFLFVGLWHEVRWAYFAWGAFHAAGLVLVNAYRAFLKDRLTPVQMKRYRENGAIRLAAWVLTFEYVAWSLAIIGIPWVAK